VLEVSVPTRDGTLLHTIVYLPAEVPAEGVPTLMERTPYRFPDWRARFAAKAQFHNSRGYAFVLQDCRGRFGSSGTYEAPFENEVADGQDATEWIASQPWSNGRIGTIGVSESAYTAVAAAVSNPRVNVVIADDGPEDNGFELAGGLIHLGYLDWRHFLDDDGSYPSDADTVAASNDLDVMALDTRLLGHMDSFWRSMAGTEIPDAPLYEGESLRHRYAEICAPVLSVDSAQSRWTDPIDLWRGLVDERCPEQRANQRLVVTPDSHGYHSTALFMSETTPITSLMLAYIDEYLGLREVDLSSTPQVQFSALGDTSYRGAAQWPPAEATSRLLYLHHASGATDGALSAAAPDAEDPDSLMIDPATMDPCDPAYPYLAYVSAPLAAPLFAVGTGRVTLFVSTTTPDADVVADLYEYRPGSDPAYQHVGSTAGVRLRYRNGFSSPAPMNPGEAAEVAFDLFPLSYRFQQGSSIVLALSNGACDFAENPQSGEPVAAQSERRAATIRYFHDAQHPARLELPELIRYEKGAGS
jgi:putative CocE/NonD family hydrolase